MGMRKGFFVVAPAAAAVVVACSSSSTPAKFAGRTPQYHYSEGSSCRTTRPVGDGDSDASASPSASTCNGGDEGACCSSDAQCTAGSNGRCVHEGFAEEFLSKYQHEIEQLLAEKGN